MKVKLKLVGFPEAERLMGGKEIDLKMDGNTYGDLLRHLEKSYGGSMMKNLRVPVIRNGREWIGMDDLSYPLQEGDRLTFLQVMGGGQIRDPQT